MKYYNDLNDFSGLDVPEIGLYDLYKYNQERLSIFYKSHSLHNQFNSLKGGINVNIFYKGFLWVLNRMPLTLKRKYLKFRINKALFHFQNYSGLHRLYLEIVAAQLSEWNENKFKIEEFQSEIDKFISQINKNMKYVRKRWKKYPNLNRDQLRNKIKNIDLVDKETDIIFGELKYRLNKIGNYLEFGDFENIRLDTIKRTSSFYLHKVRMYENEIFQYLLPMFEGNDTTIVMDGERKDVVEFDSSAANYIIQMGDLRKKLEEQIIDEQLKFSDTLDEIELSKKKTKKIVERIIDVKKPINIENFEKMISVIH